MAEQRKDLQTYYDRNQIVFGNDPSLIPKFLKTGITELDNLLNGGLRLKTMSMFVGLEGNGKTWTAQQVAKKNIEDDRKVIYIDLEKAYMPEWWQEVGVDIKKLVVATPHYAEEALDMIQGMLEDYDLLIIDSMAAMMPTFEDENSAESNPQALQARFNSKFFRIINSKNRKSHVFIINQLRESVGIIYGNPSFIPGGAAQRFFVNSIIQCKRKSWIEETEGTKKKRIGWNLEYQIINKHRGKSVAGDSVIVPVLFSGKIDEIGQLIETALSLGFINQNVASYELIDKKTGEIYEKIRGKAKLNETLMENKELLEKLRNFVYE